MEKLMKAVQQEYQAIPKQVPKLTQQQQVVKLKQRKLKIVCRSIGSTLFASGMLLFYRSKLEQEKYLCPWWNLKQSPPRLVTTGPYTYSRNPMYVAYLIMYTSTGIFFLNWIFLALPCFGIAVMAFNFYDKTYIPIEEDKLTRTFGEKYVMYQAITPKWIGLPRRIGPQSGNEQLSQARNLQSQYLSEIA